MLTPQPSDLGGDRPVWQKQTGCCFLARPQGPADATSFNISSVSPPTDAQRLALSESIARILARHWHVICAVSSISWSPSAHTAHGTVRLSAGAAVGRLFTGKTGLPAFPAGEIALSGMPAPTALRRRGIRRFHGRFYRDGDILIVSSRSDTSWTGCVRLHNGEVMKECGEADSPQCGITKITSISAASQSARFQSQISPGFARIMWVRAIITH